MMLRELIRIGIAGLTGLILGIILWMGNSLWYFILIGPFFVIGILYGGKKIISWSGHIFGAWVTGVFFSGLSGCLFKTTFLLVGLVVLLTVGWVVGCVVAGISVYSAISHDIIFGNERQGDRPKVPNRNHPSNSYITGFDDWDDDRISDKSSDKKYVEGFSNKKENDDWLDF